MTSADLFKIVELVREPNLLSPTARSGPAVQWQKRAVLLGMSDLALVSLSWEWATLS